MAISFALGGLVLSGCGSKGHDMHGTGGAAGGPGGIAGLAGMGGLAGQPGAGGTPASGGSGPGCGTGGAAGAAGSGGLAGVGGQAGVAGQAGVGGQAGVAGTGGTAGAGGQAGAPIPGDVAWLDIYGFHTGDVVQSVEDVATAPGGDLFITGTFTNTIEILGSGITSAGDSDAFIARIHGDGSRVWVHSEGGSTRDTGLRVIALPDGSAVMTGTTSGMPVFGAGDENETTFTGDPTNGTADFCFYLARLDVSGALAWAHQACSDGNQTRRILGISAAADGTFYATGSFLGTLVLGSDGSSPITLSVPGQSGTVSASFVARFAASGQPMWAHALTNMVPTSAAALPSGGAVFALQPDLDQLDNPPGTFGAGQSNAVTVPANAQSAIARYDASGNFQWATFATGPVNQTRITTAAMAVVPTAGSGFNVTGSVQDGPATFAAGTSHAVMVTPVPTGNISGALDAFVAHYDETGTLVWLKQEGGPAQEMAVDIAATPDGGAVVVGLFGVLASPGQGVSPPTTATFGTGEPGQVTLTEVGTVDSFVLRVAADGTLLWAEREGGAPVQPVSNIGLVTASGVATFPDGSSVNVGETGGEVVFGEHLPGQHAEDLGPNLLYAARLMP